MVTAAAAFSASNRHTGPMASALEAALDELFQVAPEQFVEARKALAAKLGKGADAKVVLEQKKPTRVAHLLNRLARLYPADVAALASIGERLAAAHLAGQTDALREVIAAQRLAVNALSAQASVLMTALGVAASELPTISAVLYAATTSAERAAQLKQGRLSKAPEANVSFFGAASIAVTESSQLAPDPEPKNENVEVEQPSVAELEAEKKRVQAAVRARVAADNAEAEATRAREAVEAIEAELEALEAAAHDAAAALASAKLKVERASERLVKAQAEATQRAKEAAALAVPR